MIHTEYVFTRMLVWQVVATSLVALIIFFIAGKSAAISACLGGFSVIFASGFASLIFARNKRKQDAASILVSLLISEIVKLIFVFSFLILVFRHYKSLVPAALIIGLMAAALISGAAISKIKSQDKS